MPASAHSPAREHASRFRLFTPALTVLLAAMAFIAAPSVRGSEDTAARQQRDLAFFRAVAAQTAPAPAVAPEAPRAGGDRDDDGMPDAWETGFGFNPDDPTDAWADADHDGVVNLFECHLGSHPRSVATPPRVYVSPGCDLNAAITTASSGSLILVAGGTYRLNYVGYTAKTFMLQGGWNCVFTERDLRANPTCIDGGAFQEAFYLNYTQGCNAVIFDGLTITNARGYYGAVACISSGYATEVCWGFLNCRIVNSTNLNAPYGGGILQFCHWGGRAQVFCANTLIANNCGSGIYNQTIYGALARWRLCNLTIADNFSPPGCTVSGYGLESTVQDTAQLWMQISNTIFWRNSREALSLCGNVTACVSHTDLGGGICTKSGATYLPKPPILCVDPRFIDTRCGNYCLAPTSPCIDAGIDVGLPYARHAPDLGACESNLPAPRMCPDMMIRCAGESGFAGNNLYQVLTGQTKEQAIPLNGTASYHLRIQNDGNVADDFCIRGSGGNSEWQVTYYNALSGGTNVTNAVTGDGAVIPNIPAGGYRDFRVEVKCIGGQPGAVKQVHIEACSMNDTACTDFVMAVTTQIPPLSCVALCVSPPSPQILGVPVTITAVPTGGCRVEYLFRVGYRDTAWHWTTLRTYGPSPTCTWLPEDTQRYTVVVWAREVGCTAPYQVGCTLTYLVKPPVTAVCLSATPASTQPVNTLISLFATPTGGVHVEYQFGYELTTPAGRQTVCLRDYSPVRLFSWRPLVAGTYTLFVRAREIGNTAPCTAECRIIFVVTPIPLAAVTATLAPSCRAPVNTDIVIIAAAIGGTNVQFQFRAGYDSGGTMQWRVIRDYSTAATCTWRPTVARAYTIVVRARDDSGGTTIVKQFTADYLVTPPLTGITLGANPPTACRINTTVTLEAIPTGGANVEYCFRIAVQEDGTWVWHDLSDYIDMPICTWVPTTPGNYRLCVRAREIDCTEPFTVEAVINYRVNP